MTSSSSSAEQTPSRRIKTGDLGALYPQVFHINEEDGQITSEPSLPCMTLSELVRHQVLEAPESFQDERVEDFISPHEVCCSKYRATTYDDGEEDVGDFQTVSSISRMSAVTDIVLLSDPELGTGRILFLLPPQPDESSVDRPPRSPPPRLVNNTKSSVGVSHPLATIEFGKGAMQVPRSMPAQSFQFKKDDACAGRQGKSLTKKSKNTQATRRMNHWRYILYLFSVALVVGAAGVFILFHGRESKKQPSPPPSPAGVAGLTNTNQENTVESTLTPWTAPLISTPAPSSAVPLTTVAPTRLEQPKSPESAALTTSPTTAPTESPSSTRQTSSPISLEEGILSAFSGKNHFYLDAANIPGSPQRLAYDFLIQTTDFGFHSPERIIQRYAMAVIYYSTSGNSWDQRDGWLDIDDECSWYSRDSSPCDVQGRLVRLDLSSNNMLGEIPKEIGLLQKLEEIRLDRNDIMGQIPVTMGDLGNLRTLDLSWTVVDGDIPSELGDATSLQNINLVGSSVRGHIPSSIGELSRMKNLLLARTNLEGALPDSVCSIPGLEEVWADCDTLLCSCCNYCCYRENSIDYCEYV